MKEKKCNLKSCGKKIGYAFINTALGEFCSAECREKVEKNVFRLLIDLPLPNDYKPL